MTLTTPAAGSVRPRGIPTTYRGTRFRSRLEARWAALFDLIGWQWTYEPFDTDGWIPDFLISGAFPFLVEAGPCVDETEYLAKGAKAREAFPPRPRRLGPEGDSILLDIPERWTLVVGATAAYSGSRWLATAAGFWATSAFPDGRASAAFWYCCGECDLLGVESSDLGYLRPCGHVSPVHPTPGRFIADLWGQAGNEVQWRGRR